MVTGVGVTVPLAQLGLQLLRPTVPLPVALAFGPSAVVPHDDHVRPVRMFVLSALMSIVVGFVPL